MSKIPSVNATLKDAGSVRTVWESTPDFKMGEFSLQDFIAIQDATEASAKEYAAKDVELTGIKGKRDDYARQLNDRVTRFRSLVRGVYGPDSAQYGQAGGTRVSQRKAPKARAKAATA